MIRNLRAPASLITPSLFTGLLLTACGGREAFEQTGEIQGEVQVYAVDSFENEEGGRSVGAMKFYQLTDTQGQQFELLLPEHLADVTGGDQVSVRGVREGNQIQVEWLEKTALAEQALTIDPPPLQPVLKALAISYDPKLTAEDLKKRVSQDVDGTERYYHYTSYGIWTMQVDTFQAQDVSTSGCATSSAATSGKEKAKAAGIDLSQYKLFMHVLPSSAGCSWAGMAAGGKVPAQAGGGRGKLASESFYVTLRCRTLNQELTHNYGLMHTHYCTGGGAKEYPAKGCAGFNEYGDPFTPSAGCGHLHGIEMGLMMFIEKCNVVTAGSGTYEIGPITQMCNGPQVLRVDEGNGNGYYVEYRTPTAIDPKEGVLWHYGGMDFAKLNVDSLFLVNPKGGKNSEALMGVGTEFTTPGGNTFKVLSFEGGKAKIEITSKNTGATCLDGAKFEPTVVCKEWTGGGGGGAGGAGGTGGSSGRGGGSPTGGTGAGGSGGNVTGGRAVGGSGGASGGTGGNNNSGGTGAVSGGKGGAGGAGGTGAAVGSGAAGKAGQGTVTGGNTGNPGSSSDGEGCGCSTPVKGGSNSGTALSALVGLCALARVRLRARRRLNC